RSDQARLGELSESRRGAGGSAAGAPSRERMGTRRGFPFPSRVGAQAAPPPEPHRGRVWEPAEGSHFRVASGRRRLRRRSPIAGGYGNPPRGPISKIGSGVADGDAGAEEDRPVGGARDRRRVAGLG